MTDSTIFQQVATLEGWDFIGDSEIGYLIFQSKSFPEIKINEEQFCFRMIKKYQINVEYYSQHGPVVGWRASHYCDEHCIELFNESLEQAVCMAVIAIKEGEG